MKKLVILFGMFMSVCAIGQEHYLGIKTGLNWTDVSSTNFLSGNTETREQRAGFNGGLMYEYHIDEMFHLGVDFLYAQKGFSQKIGFIAVNGGPLDEENSEYNFDYISLPIKGGITIGNKVSGFANLGITPSILVSSFIITPEIPGFSQENKTNLTNKASRFDMGGIAEIGVNYEILDSTVLFTSIGYQVSFTSLTTDKFFPSGEARHSGLVLALGLKYRLKSAQND